MAGALEFMTRLCALEWPSASLLEFIILTASRSGEARGAFLLPVGPGQTARVWRSILTL